MKYIQVSDEDSGGRLQVRLQIKEAEIFGLELITECCNAREQGIEAVAARFHDPSIVIYLNGEGRYLFDSLSVLLTTGEDLPGPLFICSTNDEGDEIGLTDDQINIVQVQLKLLNLPQQPTLPSSELLAFDSLEKLVDHVKEVGADIRRKATWPGLN